MEAIQKKMSKEVFGRAVKKQLQKHYLIWIKRTKNECNFLEKVESKFVIWKITRTFIVFQKFLFKGKKCVTLPHQEMQE